MNTQAEIITTPTTKIKVIDFGDEELIFAPYSWTVELDGEEVEVSVLHDSWGRVDSLDEHDPAEVVYVVGPAEELAAELMRRKITEGG